MLKKTSIIFVVLILLSFAFAACQPQVIVETVEVEKEVIVEKEVEVVVEKEVEVEVEKTVVVEVEVEKEMEEVSAEGLTLAVLLGGLINDGGFNSVGYQAILEAQKEGVETTYIEQVSTADVGGLMSDYASQGFDIVYAYSGAYQSSVFDTAPLHPETTFVAFTGPERVEGAPDNVWISGNAFEDAYYLSGVLAGLMTETNVIGYVGGANIPVYVAGAVAYEEGAKSVNPDVEVLSLFTGSQNDALAAKEATTGQIESGADIINSTQNHGLFGVIAAAEAAENHVWVIGLTSDQKDLSPEFMLTSVTMDYGAVLVEIVKGVAAGEPGGYAPINLETGYAGLAPFYGEVPDDVLAKLEEVTQQLIAGEIDYTTAADL
jgi:basic membrane protein A and related proteins